MNETWWVESEQLDENQKDVLQLPVDGSYLVIGPPGSGKTNLLLLRGSYIVRSGFPDVLILVFTRTLREFVSTGGNQYAFATDKIKTYTSWGTELLWQHGINIDLQNDFETNRMELFSQLNNLIQDKKLSDLYDAVLLDEAHDYLPEEVELFHRLGKRFFAVVDSRQKIYSGSDSISTLSNLVDATFTLQHHYRNGMQICRLADKIAKGTGGYVPLEPYSNYDELSKPSTVTCYCGDLEEQAQQIIDSLDLQLKAYPDELLGVICPRHEELEAIWEHIQGSHLEPISILQSFKEGYVPFEPHTRICVSTLHSAKGLEFRTLHLAACDLIKKFATQRNMAFTAVTRAKTSLSIYHSENLPGYLESALASLEPAQDPPDVEDLFVL